jgi:hypothetical protein
MSDMGPVSAAGPREPCVVCGEETAVASVFYSDRWTVSRREGSPTYLCSLCGTRVGSAATGRRLTDDQLRNLVANGSGAGVTWVDRGAFSARPPLP